MSGRTERAPEIAQAFARAPPEDDVWWGYKNGVLDHESLQSLRERVRK